MSEQTNQRTFNTETRKQGNSGMNCGSLKDISTWDFPGGAVVRNLPAKEGDTGSSPGPGRSHMPRSN